MRLIVYLDECSSRFDEQVDGFILRSSQLTLSQMNVHAYISFSSRISNSLIIL